MSDERKRIAAIEARLNAATPGPWKVYETETLASYSGQRDFPNVAPSPELRIGTAGDHPQLKAPLPLSRAPKAPSSRQRRACSWSDTTRS